MKGLTIKSLMPACTASTTMASWPMAEHITTLALLSLARMAFSASSPSMFGMVMSIRTKSGWSSKYFSTASLPSTASCRSVKPFLVSVSRITFRMKAASSTIRILAMFLIPFFISVSLEVCQAPQFRLLEYLCDTHAEVIVDNHYVSPRNAQAVHKDIHLVSSQLVQNNQ